MVMLASALQRSNADSKARESKVETSVALQQEVSTKLIVLSDPNTNTTSPNVPKLSRNSSQMYGLKQTQPQVEPHNDFFTAQFLVPFPQVELRSIHFTPHVCNSADFMNYFNIIFTPGWPVQYEHQHRMERR